MSMKRTGLAAAFLALSLVTSFGARAAADELDRGPDPGAAFLVGAATEAAGLAVGGSMVAMDKGYGPLAKTGFLVLEGGFVLAPILAHGVVDEWRRGALFAILPTVALGATITLFSVAPGAVTDQDLGEVRVLWSMVTVGMLTATAGVIDATFVRSRTIHVTPTATRSSAGLSIGGTF